MCIYMRERRKRKEGGERERDMKEFLDFLLKCSATKKEKNKRALRIVSDVGKTFIFSPNGREDQYISASKEK